LIRENLQKKKKKKSQSDMWQSVFMVVNDLNGVSKNDQIEQNAQTNEIYLNTTP